MDIDHEQSKPDSGRRAGAMGGEVSRGFAWLVAQTAGAKVVSLGTQVALAWLLLEEHFGLVALAYSIAVFVNRIKAGGLREVLVQQQHRFRELAGAAFWLSALLGLTAALLLLLVAPLAARMFSEPELVGLIWVLAVAAPLMAPLSVPMARLQSQMRFRAIAIVDVCLLVAKAVLAITLAAYGFGAYAFVLPLPVIGAVRLAIMWRLARPPIDWGFQWRGWGELIGSGGLLTSAGLFGAVNQHGANFILGLFHSASVVGIFYLAFNLSKQVHNVLMMNLSYVLLPSFSRLQAEPRRQLNAFVRAGSVLALVGMPAALVVVAAAEPLVRALFEDRWLPAIPVLQALAAGMALNINASTADNFIKAQGRFGPYLVICGVRTFAFVAMVTAGALLGGALAVGIAAGLYLALHGPSVTYLAIRPAGCGWREVGRIHAAPFIVGALAAAVAMLLSAVIPDWPARDWMRLATVLVVFPAVYLPLIRWGAPDPWNQLIGQLRPIVQRLIPGTSLRTPETGAEG